MTKPKNPKSPPDTDPYIYASMLNGYVTDGNPLQKILGELMRMIMSIVHLKKNRQLAQLRIEQMQSQITKVQEDIASVNPPQQGTRFNKLR